jgi:hypothetical protein
MNLNNEDERKAAADAAVDGITEGPTPIGVCLSLGPELEVKVVLRPHETRVTHLGNRVFFQLAGSEPATRHLADFIVEFTPQDALIFAELLRVQATKAAVEGM